MTLERKREKMAEILVEASKETGIGDGLMADDIEAICLSIDEDIYDCCGGEDMLLIMFLQIDRIYRDRDYAAEVKVDKFEQLGVMLDYLRESLLKQMGR